MMPNHSAFGKGIFSTIGPHSQLTLAILRQMKLFAILLVSILTTSAAEAATTQLGTPSCGSWVKSRDEMLRSGANWPATVNLYWLNGFLSGQADLLNIMMNKGGGNYDLLKGYDPDSILLNVDNYCREHPLSYINEAADNMLKDMMGKITPIK